MQVQFHLRPIPAPDVIPRMLAFSERAYGPEREVHLHLHPSIEEGAISVPAQRIAQLREHPQIKKWSDLFKKHPLIEVRSLEIRCSDNQYPNAGYRWDLESSLSVIYFEDHGQPVARQRFPAFLDALDALDFKLMRRQVALSQDASAEVRSRAEFQETVLRELTGQTARLGQYLAEQTEKLATHWAEREAALAARATAAETAARAAEEEGRRRVQTEAAARNAELEQREKALARRSSELDIREYRASSRAQFQDLIKELEKDLSVDSKVKPWAVRGETLAKRKIVHCLFWVSLLVFGLMAGFGANALLTTPHGTPMSLNHWIPFAAGMLGFGPTLIFYVRWTMRWFEEHARREFNNDRLIADVRRAGWVVELLHAWHEEETKGDFPPALVDTLSRNLFVLDGQTPVEHPAVDAAKAMPQVAEAAAEAAQKTAQSIGEVVSKVRP